MAAGRARPAAVAARPLSTGSVETSDGEQPPSWIPHPSATRPVPPSHATKLRKVVLNIVKKEAVNSQYGIYYYLLTAGARSDGKIQGASILADDFPENIQKMFQPKVPAQIVNEFALKAAKTIDKIAEEAIEMILPADWKQIADNRTFSKTKSTLGFEA